MKKNITKEQIIETALELMRNKTDFQGLNLREIARTLGCAHTNLYNYFPSYNDLLWKTHTAVLQIFMDMLAKKLATANTAKLQLFYFFSAFADMYLDNKGWFHLLWQEHVGGQRPQQNIQVTETAANMLYEHISEIWKELTGEYPDAVQAKRILHNTHCYIVGEVSNYLLGRGPIATEPELKAYITSEAIQIFRLCLASKSNEVLL